MQQTIEGLADTVDNVRLAQLQDGNAVQLVVGYLAAQGDSYLAVYSYEHGEVNAILEQSYEQYLVEDITGGGNEDLILMSTLEDGGVQIELLTVNRDGSFQQVAVMGLSADKFSGCASVASGLGADGRHYLVLDGWTGISGNNLATVLLRFDEESQQMIPAEQISASALYSASLRNVPNLVSRDLDGDGTVEIPTQPDEAGLLNMSQSRRMDFIVWMDYTRPDPERASACWTKRRTVTSSCPPSGRATCCSPTAPTSTMRWSCAPWTKTSWCSPCGWCRPAPARQAGPGWAWWHPPDAGKVGRGCRHPGPDLSAVPLVVSAELSLSDRLDAIQKKSVEKTGPAVTPGRNRTEACCRWSRYLLWRTKPASAR